EHLADRGGRVDADAAMQLRSKRMKPELERRHDPEVPARSSDTPEQVRLLGLAGPDQATVRRDELDGPQVVDRQSELPLQPADAATEREPSDARVADDADRADEAVGLRRHVELAEERAAVCSG